MIACFAGLLSALPARAAVRLPAIFGDHMVLQRDVSAPVWGWAMPSEKVVVGIAEAVAETVTGADGRWRVALDLSRSGPGPFQMIVSGTNRVVLNNVLVGEVWLASGQSNMEFALRQSIGGPETAAASSNSLLRFFKVARRPWFTLSATSACAVGRSLLGRSSSSEVAPRWIASLTNSRP